MLKNSAIYALGDVFVRFSGLLLIPLYTRYLTPEDYGILSTANTITAILGIVMMLSLLAAFTRFYFDASSHEAKQRLLSSLVYAMLLWALLLAAALWLSGQWLFALLTDIPFHPIIELAIVIALAGLLPQVILAVLQVQEQAGKYALLTVGSFFITVGFVIYHVVFLEQGAQGSLQGTLVGMLMMSVVALMLLARNWLVLSFDGKQVKSSLVYALPLVPHLLLIWVMMGSDILILQYFRPMDEVGIYALGYTLGFAFFVVTGAFSKAWSPIFYRHADDAAQHAKLSQIVTTMLVAMLLLVSGAMLFLDEAIMLITIAPFYDVSLVIPWVALSAVFHVVYISYVNILFYDKKTWHVAGVSACAALLNVLLNMVFIPEFGMQAAAISTALAYMLQMALVWWLATRIRRFAYCPSKLFYACLACVVMYGGGRLIESIESLGLVVGLKTLLVAAVLFVLYHTETLRWHDVEKITAHGD